jgi:hypothetical protein
VLDANRLRVRVVDTDGRPVPGADVLATGPRGSTSTNASGLEGAATVDGYPGLWTIRASASGAAAAEEELLVTRGTHEYEVRLELDFEPRTGDLRVVLDDGSGTRVSDFEVALFDGQERGFAPVYRGLEPDADGLVAGVPVGRWIARVRPREWRTATWFDVEADVDVLEGHTSELGLSTTRGGRIELVLAAAGGGPDEPTAVKVRVVDLYGAPIDSLDVVHRSLESGGVQYSSPRLGERGTSELLPAGTWVLAVEAEGWAPVERTVHVPAGETVPVEVELRRR